MPKGFLPNTDAGLLAWSVNFKTLIVANPTIYGLTVVQANTYAGLHNAYASAYQTAMDPSTRTKGKVAAKNAAREALKTDARLLASIIQGQASVTDEQKINLGLAVRAVPTPIPAPTEAPGLDVVTVSGRTVSVRLHGSSGASKRGKPAGVQGASVFSFVGDAAPATIADWKFEGSTTKTTFDVQFDASVAPGAKVWLTAFWFNPRSQSGPACAPISTNVQFGNVSMAA